MKDLNVKFFTRREFINDLKKKAALGLLSSAGFALLAQCSGSAPDSDDLDPPFICKTTDGCSSGYGGTSDYTQGTAPTYLVFSGYNPETGFSGYNIYYGASATIISEHSTGTRNLVIDPTGSLTVDCASLGGGTYPTIPVSLATGVLNAATYVVVQVNNTTGGNALYVTAYNSTDNVESVLSNVYTV